MRNYKMGSTKKYRDQRIPCDERKRLEEAFQRAKRQEEKQADAAYERSLTIDGGRSAQATNQRSKAGLHSAHILDELNRHEREHRCVPRFFPRKKDD
jgi:hypothetical protein